MFVLYARTYFSLVQMHVAKTNIVTEHSHIVTEHSRGHALGVVHVATVRMPRSSIRCSCSKSIISVVAICEWIQWFVMFKEPCPLSGMQMLLERSAKCECTSHFMLNPCEDISGDLWKKKKAAAYELPSRVSRPTLCAVKCPRSPIGRVSSSSHHLHLRPHELPCGLPHSKRTLWLVFCHPQVSPHLPQVACTPPMLWAAPGLLVHSWSPPCPSQLMGKSLHISGATYAKLG